MATQQAVSFFQNISILLANGSFNEVFWSSFNPEVMTMMHQASH